MNENDNKPAVDSEPPIALDKFVQESGLSVVTVWRYRRWMAENPKHLWKALSDAG
jgi:hypothetical protein